MDEINFTKKKEYNSNTVFKSLVRRIVIFQII